MNFNGKRILGKTAFQVGRLGISSSFGAPAEAYEEAFERGCNYFSWGSVLKGRSSEMKKAMINIIQKGQRDRLVISMNTCAHNVFLTEKFLMRGLKALEIDYADVLILGYYPKRPRQRVIKGALRLKEKGLVRYLGITSHNRTLFPGLAKEGLFDVFHIRYNAAHRGAEVETFPHLEGENRPGVVTFTATRWGQLLNPKKMPPGEKPSTSIDCYRFVLSHPAVDTTLMGAQNIKQMRENLKILDYNPMSEEELTRMRKIGDYVHGK